MSDHFGLVSWGEKVGGDLPADHLAFLDSHRTATEERVERARAYWRERDPQDFEKYGVTGRRVRDRATGEVFVLVEHDPWATDRPEEEPITCFVQNGGWIHYLRPFGVDAAAVGTGLTAAVVAGVVENDGRTLRDVETGTVRKWNRRRGRFA